MRAAQGIWRLNRSIAHASEQIFSHERYLHQREYNIFYLRPNFILFVQELYPASTFRLYPKSTNISCCIPNSMPNVERVMRSAFQSDESLRDTLKEVIGELGLSAREFSRISEIPQSTLYKILSGHREPNITTLRQIVKTIRQLEGSGGDFIAIIAARPVLDKISEKKMKIGERLLTLREYSATNIEEAIIAAVRAERDGASALVCAPIVSPTVEKLLTIPVATIIPQESVVRAIEVAARKIE